MSFSSSINVSSVTSTTNTSIAKPVVVDLLDESLPIDTKEQTYYDAVREIMGSNTADEQVIRIARSYRSNQKTRMDQTVTAAKTIMEWRQSNNVDQLLSTTLPNERTYYESWPSAIYGTDSYGHLVNVERLADIKADTLQSSFQLVDLLKHRIKHMEMIQHEKAQLSNSLQRRVYKHIYVFDLSGIGFKHASKSVVDILKPIFDLGQLYYPESLFRMYLINAPTIFYGMWKMVSGLIDVDTREKIQVLKNANQFIEMAISHGIPKEVIPEYLGGKGKPRYLDNTFITKPTSVVVGVDAAATKESTVTTGSLTHIAGGNNGDLVQEKVLETQQQQQLHVIVQAVVS